MAPTGKLSYLQTMFGLDTPPDALLRGIILSALGLIWVSFLVRLVGLRALSKMTAIDFVVTLATGSLLAKMIAVSSWSDFLQLAAGIAMLIVWQYGYAMIRRSRAVRHFVENQPVLLMRNGKFLDTCLHRHRITRADVLAKIRAANICDLDQVDAVVLEVTGDIAVLSGAGGAQRHIMGDVRNA